VRLDDFVASTLEQLIAGVRRAQEAAGPADAAVNPAVRTGTPGKFDGDTGTHIQDIEFDVALTVQSSEKTGGELGVAVWPLKVGIGGASESQHETVSRVRFSVPLRLPRQPKS
jgi:hypothetical protein